MQFKRLLIFLFFLIPSTSMLKGQEIVTGLISNSRVRDAWKLRDILKSGSPGDTLELPFFDDFSFSDIYPADTLWTDNFVYINNTYPAGQLTTGVATFDAIDDRGLIYENASSYGFEADHLTSAPINLQYDPSEDIFLSFFYQPQGIVDPPDPGDSLTLQFYSPIDESWNSVWRADGGPVHPFRAVNIGIDDTRFLQDGFRFRFINWASLSSSNSDPGMIGNADQWHIDYVVLDRGRSPGDTIPADVAFTSPMRSLLNTYESMPWDQFKEISLSEMGLFLTLNYKNNDSIIRNVSRSFSIYDVYNDSFVYSKTPVATNVDPFAEINVDASLLYTFNSSSTDSALFLIKSVLVTDDFDPKINDTITYYQEFNDWFSYDDGSSEAGYGVNGENTRDDMVALLYRSYIEDTLRAVNICFNDSYLSANQRLFDIAVWNEVDGYPGDLLYSQKEVMVDPGESLNGFTTYKLDNPVPVSGNFFVGWIQRSTTFLNVGLDLNTPSTGKLFYFHGGTWNNSFLDATLMVRPLFGPNSLSTGVETYTDINNKILIWPNPAGNYLNLDIESLSSSGRIGVEIFDTGGRKVLETNTTGTIDLTTLPQALYLLIIKSDDTIISYNKFIRLKR